MRVTSNSMANRLLGRIQQSQQRLAAIQEQVGTGKRLNRPSDDPFTTSRVLDTHTRAENNAQYQRNAAVAKTDLTAAEAALTSLHDALARASELAVQAASGNLTAADRANIALEVGQLLAEAVSLGNTRHAGRFLFAGHQTATLPFTEDIPGNPTTVTYNGDGGAILREISEAERVQVNVVGSNVWPGVYAALIQFRDDLAANNLPGVQNAVGQINGQIDASLQLRSDLGAKMRRVEIADLRLQDEEALLLTVRSNLEDVDLADAIVKLQIQETAFEAALGVTARTLNLSLLDFLR